MQTLHGKQFWLVASWQFFNLLLDIRLAPGYLEKSFEDAVSYLQARGFQRPNAADASPETMVWVVTMEGQWPQNFPPLREGEPMREPYRHLSVTLEAETGDPLDLSVLSQ
jgi:hypothetical protein